MKRGLGKGLGALIGDDFDKEGKRLIEADILSIDVNRDQPREEFDKEKLEELAQSIAEQGILQPIVTQEKNGRYSIVAGERRFRAAKLAGLKKVPIIIGEFTEKERLELALLENIQREDLNAMEQAKALNQLAERYKLTQEEIAQRMGKSRSAIANLMRLMSLPVPVQAMVRDGRLSYGHARCLLGLNGKEAICAAANEIIAKELSVRQTEQLVKKSQSAPKKKKAKPQASVPVEISSAQDDLSEVLETKVKIHGDFDSGKIVIEYYNKEHLEQIYDYLLTGKK